MELTEFARSRPVAASVPSRSNISRSIGFFIRAAPDVKIVTGRFAVKPQSRLRARPEVLASARTRRRAYAQIPRSRHPRHLRCRGAACLRLRRGGGGEDQHFLYLRLARLVLRHLGSEGRAHL